MVAAASTLARLLHKWAEYKKTEEYAALVATSARKPADEKKLSQRTRELQRHVAQPTADPRLPAWANLLAQACSAAGTNAP